MLQTPVGLNKHMVNTIKFQNEHKNDTNINPDVLNKHITGTNKKKETFEHYKLTVNVICILMRYPDCCKDCIYTCLSFKHSVSQTTSRCGLPDLITFQSRSIYTLHYHTFFLIKITYLDADCNLMPGVNGVKK